MRINNIFKNINVSFLYSFLNLIFSFILRTIFIHKLGTEYLGLNSILANILSMLSIAELGIGSAIGFSLYKPISQNNTKKINALMQYYKKSYQIIGFVILVLGICLVPFLDAFITNITAYDYIYFIYLLYLLNTVIGYFFTYKRTLIIANQKNYVLTKYLMIFKLITYFSQMFILIFTSNYILYIIAQFTISLLENLYVNYQINKQYPYLNNKEVEELTKEEKSVITKNVKAMLFHKIGDYCINSTDNLIIAHFINITIVGIYSNYYTLIYNVNQFLTLIFQAASASFGNLIASTDKNTVYTRFKTFNFLAFWLFGFATLCLYFLMTPFIEHIWLGKDYVISNSVIMIVMLNFFFVSMRVPLGIVKSAAGVYDQDKFIPFLQSLVNLIVSIVLVQKYGLVGVFIGTLASSVLVVFVARPYVVYKYVFEKPLINYFKLFFQYFFSLLFYAFFIHIIFNYIYLSNEVFNFIFKCIILCIIPNVLNYLFFRNTDEFKDLINMGKRILKRRKHG